MLQRGAGWRLGWACTPAGWRGLIGADSWAFEVDCAELQELARYLPEVVTTMAAMAEELADGEELTCEAGGDRLHLSATGFPERYRVYVRVGGDRPAEGFWDSTAMAEMLAVLAQGQVLWGSDL
ncbi:MAG: DUF1818 family protein [Pseudanabaenaceae cyanobacterium]